jgi:hypothetical protein
VSVIIPNPLDHLVIRIDAAQFHQLDRSGVGIEDHRRIRHRNPWRDIPVA